MRRPRVDRPSAVSAIICACSGLAIPFAFWPYRAPFIAYFALVPFVIFSGIRDGRSGLLRNCYIFGLAYFLGTLYWIAMLQKEQMTMPWLRLPAATVLGLYLALFVLIMGFVARRLVLLGLPFELALGVAWGGIEYLRSLGPLGFPWASLGYSQTPYVAVIQQAALFGTYGISVWLVILNGLVARFILSRRTAVLVLAAVVFAVPVGCGKLVLARAPKPQGVHVALIQPNIEGAVKWDAAYRDSTMKILSDMTLEASGAEMVVWPETAVPLYVKHSSAYLDSIVYLARHTGSYLLTGFPDYERTSDGIKYYNSAMLISPAGQVVGEYRKIHLVPFGEMIPFADRIAPLRGINFGGGDFSPGTTYNVFQLATAKFGVAICFESIYPSLVRKFVDGGAQFIVNITNDEWFGPSAGPFQHAQMAIMRSVECRVGLARCANTGVSMLVDPYGRVSGETKLFSRAILAGEVSLGSGRTPYRKGGYLFEWALLGASAALAAASYVPGLARAKPAGQRV